MSRFAESHVEEAGLEWFKGLGYAIEHGPDLLISERGDDYGRVVLIDRLRSALSRLNPRLPSTAIDEAVRKLTIPESATPLANNQAMHRLLVDGVPVECQRADGSTAGEVVQVFDFNDPGANEFLAVNQFTVSENKHERRPDIVVFVNGLPLAVIELKNAADEKADVWKAFSQLQTYKLQIPSLFAWNAILIASDGLTGRIGTLTADRERFMPWRTIEGETLAPKVLTELQIIIEGVFEKSRFLQLLRHFIVFEDDGSGNVVKKLAGYHQFHAVNLALASTLQATKKTGDRRAGVVWHTQGSGKSLTMAFYAGRVILEPAMQNPTIVVITDRNDLDDQLFGTFSRCQSLLRQQPAQAESREHLRELLKTASGGVVFTTVQKFFKTEDEVKFPVLSDRRNIVVMADEAHRSQYDFIDGYAVQMRDALPQASFIGFTGTPIEKADANTRAVFGDYVSVYDIERAVQDGATVPIYYESRLAKLKLDESKRPTLDEEFEEATEGEEADHKEKLKTKWAALEALVGAEERINLVAADLVAHWEKRLEAMDGKAMIVCMSRRICVDLYNALVKLRPAWHSDDDAAGAVKIVMTGSASDPLEWQPHIRSKPRREELAKRFKKASDPFKIVIVRDMWLTGFDAPCLHTMYADKPMRGHGLMQAIARVNRVFKDKPGGLIVDYLGLAHELKQALATYTESGGHGKTAIDQEEAIEAFLKHFEICEQFFHGFDRSKWIGGTAAEKLSVLPAAQEHVLQQQDGKQRFVKAVSDLSKAFALAVPSDAALEKTGDVAFFQGVSAVLAKSTAEGKPDPGAVDHAIRQIVSQAVSSDEVIDIFAAAGLKKPDISVLSDEFLAEVKGMPQKNLAVEMLKKLLQGEIKQRSRKNVVQARSFADLLEKSLTKYQNRAIETAAVIEEMISLAKDLKKAQDRGEQLGLTEDEVAFYDALEVNDSAIQVLGDAQLKVIAQELVKSVRANLTIDWTIRENVRANLRVIIKRILRKYGYPPDKAEKATATVLEQAEALSRTWTAQD
ncbi:Type-1 restriction enzyme R protein [Caulifigura coniformis]|uniref:Type I restriction enzyme endonuclease subunit n=1 Tax=Caulifigura coniformis TaxID=2527983 RepID=A0A517SIJ5_9PLAN|nr:type I restriction endonuclease subunit R [Caulifigura coniformis]QDT55948.1 Type-1 restriction enzyme R protein [Caulifigura coniformis]